MYVPMEKLHRVALRALLVGARLLVRVRVELQRVLYIVQATGVLHLILVAP